MKELLQSNVVYIASPSPSQPTTPGVTTAGGGTNREGVTGPLDSPQTPRKERRCIHCGFPRLGHPRSGCLNVTPPIPGKPPKSPGTTPRRSPRSTQPLQHNVVNQVNANNVQVHVHGVAAPQRTRKAAASESAELGIPTSPSPAPRKTRLVTRTRSEEERLDHLRDLERDHRSLVYMMPLTEDELVFQAAATQKHGFKVRTLRPEGSWSDQSKHIMLFGRDKRALDNLYDLVRRAVRAGTPLKDIMQNVGMALRLFKDVWTASSIVGRWEK